jgi:hypothetical protein
MSGIANLLINIDYLGSCNGKCAGCLLSEEERASSEPFLKIDALYRLVERLLYKHKDIENAAVVLGRGNILSLEDRYLGDVGFFIEQMAKSPANKNRNEVSVEISTSLIGKIELQIEKAKWLSDIAIQPSNITQRFIIVVNPALNSISYRENVRRFIKEMADHRGGLDGSGDVLVINISIDDVPKIETMKTLLKDIYSPVNVIWSPVKDFGVEGYKEKLGQLERFLAEMVHLSQAMDIDLNLINIYRSSHTVSGLDTRRVMADLQAGAECNYVIDKIGAVHHGMFSILGDLDPNRSVSNQNQIHLGKVNCIFNDPREEWMKLNRNRNCATCEYQQVCIASTGYRLALISLDSGVDLKDACPAGLRLTYEALKSIS